jgi:hypothetical protein
MRELPQPTLLAHTGAMLLEVGGSLLQFFPEMLGRGTTGRVLPARRVLTLLSSA